MKKLALSLLIPVFACYGEVASLNGVWTLNVKESRWPAGRKAPQNVVITIEHQEPKLKYNGEVTLADDGRTSRFSFDGAIDGREYTATEDGGERKVTFRRESDNTIRSTMTSMDGSRVETATNVVSANGKRLTRRITLKTPDETLRWTEVYDKP